MSITLFSVLTTVICSGILAAVLCILKRLRVFRRKSYINASILLYIAALLRLLLPFEFFFTRSCGFPAVCNPLRSEETMRKLKADNALPKETERREQT